LTTSNYLGKKSFTAKYMRSQSEFFVEARARRGRFSLNPDPASIFLRTGISGEDASVNVIPSMPTMKEEGLKRQASGGLQ